MILKSNGNYVAIEIKDNTNRISNDYWDGNWLKSLINIHCCGFKANFSTDLRSTDFKSFHEDLIKLCNDQVKLIEFKTLEEGLYIKGQMEATGNILWDVTAKDMFGNSLTVSLSTDNFSLNLLINEVKDILTQYPVLGDSKI
ncbi:hypothetical protein [Pedobacter ginsengisoli]|nr:hypothetical protein [Pedobacter ginsengisoli]